MGLGKLKNGRHQPITPYKGSWAETISKAKTLEQKTECLRAIAGLATSNGLSIKVGANGLLAFETRFPNAKS